MPSEILLYQPIYSFTAADFISQLEDNKGNDVVLRINANGGDPEYGWGMIAKLKERTNVTTNIKVDSKAHSMYAFMLCYANGNIECLDVSTFVIHRASYGQWFEADPELFNDARKTELNNINSFLRAAWEAKVDVKKFEKLKKVKMDDIFSLDSRIDVTLNAKEAKEIGLVKSIIPITPEKTAEIKEIQYRIAAHADIPEPEIKLTTQNNNKMTLAELKAQHHDLFIEAVKIGVMQERDRVGAYMAYVDVDPEAVAKGIKEGETLTQTAMAEFNRKAFSKQALAEIEAKSPKGVVPAKTEDKKDPTEDEKNIAAFNAEVKKSLQAIKN